MLQAFVITLREGLEAFLIIAISLAYLRKSRRSELVPAVHWGIAASVVLSLAAGWLFFQAKNQALWEGVLALAAAVSVASLTVHMWRTAKRIKRDIEGHLQTSSMKTGSAAFIGVFLFTLLMITREGMETALLMGTLVFQMQGRRHGARRGRRVWPSRRSWPRSGPDTGIASTWALFFQVTAVFLMVFVVQLLIYGFHELTEANIFPYSEALHIATEPVRPGRVCTANT